MRKVLDSAEIPLVIHGTRFDAWKYIKTQVFYFRIFFIVLYLSLMIIYFLNIGIK